jgi:hypothetical protein
MITQPMQYEEAISFILDKNPNPKEWDSVSWAQEATSVRVRSFFSAKVENARFLDRAQGFIFDYMAGTTEKVVSPDGVESIALRAGGRADFVRKMREFMIAEGMATESEMRATNQDDLENIKSTARLRLIFDTNVRQAYGFGNWKQGSTPAVLYRFPAARFIRKRGVGLPRPRHAAHEGEVRLKSDEAWWADYQNDPNIGGFGVPWEPYGVNSGMGQEDVSREEWEALTGSPPPDPPAPDPNTPKPTLTKFEASVKKMDPATKQKLIDELRAGLPKVDPKASARDAVRRIQLEGEKITISPTPEAQAAPKTETRKGENISEKLIPGESVTPKSKSAHATAMAAIDAVHGDGPLKDLEFKFKSKSGSTRAVYDTGAAGHSITLHKYDTPVTSTVHEVGHWLDHIAFNQKGTGAPYPGRFNLMKTIADEWGSYGPEFQEFIKAAKSTRAFESLMNDHRLREDSRVYLTRNHEIFARAYAQWIAVESGDQNMIDNINKDLEATRQQIQGQTAWEWDDFELVRPHMRAIFEKRQWLRK